MRDKVMEKKTKKKKIQWGKSLQYNIISDVPYIYLPEGIHDVVVIVDGSWHKLTTPFPTNYQK